MSQAGTVLQVKIQEFLTNALKNAGIGIMVYKKQKAEDPLQFSMQSTITNVSVLPHIIEIKPTAFAGDLKLPDGTSFLLDEGGRSQILERLSEEMNKPQQALSPIPWYGIVVGVLLGYIFSFLSNFISSE